MELYHVINRGVDGRKIFLDTQDYARFVHDLYEFNDTAPATEFLHIAVPEMSGRTTSRHRKRLVDIHGWVLMKNHYHLLLSERAEGSLTLTNDINGAAICSKEIQRRCLSHAIFLRKLSGYARYFEHFLYILHYVHLNSLDYFPGAKKWRERDKGTIADIPKALEYLKNYRWSSYLDYCGIQNFQSILTKTLFERSLGENYISALKEYLADRTDEELDLKSLEY